MQRLDVSGADELVKQYSGKTLLVIGFSGGSGYAELLVAQKAADAVGAWLDKTYGATKWLVVYGGDRPSAEGTVGNIVKHLRTTFKCPVLALQSDHMLSKGGVDADFVTHAHFYTTERDTAGTAVFGGVRYAPGADNRVTADALPLGATGRYLGPHFRSHLAGVIAFGGGPIALQEAQYAVAHKVPFKYIACKPNRVKAGQPYGHIHAWAVRVRSIVRDYRADQASLAAASGKPAPTNVDEVKLDDVSVEEDPGMCLTMHQPWASLLVYGIKRVEGRTWPTKHRGRLWIHAGTAANTPALSALLTVYTAAKPADPAEVAAIETQYRQIYAMDGVDGITFPAQYPTSALLGCVEVADCLTQDEFEALPNLTEAVRAESDSPYVWVCQKPMKLVMPFQMGGQHKLWQLDRKTVTGATAALTRPHVPKPWQYKP